MKISKSQIVQIIKEEAQRLKKEIILKREIASIEKELQELNEVHTGGAMDPGTGGVHAGQKKAVFTKKGSHLVEKDDDMEMQTVSGGGDDESSSDSEVPMSMDTDGGDEMSSSGPEMGDGEMGDGMGEDVAVTADQIKDAILSLGQQLNLSGVIDFDAAADGEGDNQMLDVDIETDADDVASDDASDDAGMSVASDETSSAEETPAPSDDEDNIEECGDDMAMEKKQQMEAKKFKLNEEKKRWATLAGIKIING